MRDYWEQKNVRRIRISDSWLRPLAVRETWPPRFHWHPRTRVDCLTWSHQRKFGRSAECLSMHIHNAETPCMIKRYLSEMVRNFIEDRYALRVGSLLRTQLSRQLYTQISTKDDEYDSPGLSGAARCLRSI